MPSIKKQLLKNTLIAMLSLWLVTALITIYAARHEALELLDSKLQETAYTLLAFNIEGSIKHRDKKGEEEEIENEHFPAKNDELQVQVWRNDGALIIASPNAPSVPFNPESGFAVNRQDKQSWRSFAVWDEDHSLQVRVLEDKEKLHKVVAEIVTTQLLAFLLFAPVLAIMISWSIGRGLQLLTRLASEIGTRHAQHLEPVPDENIPAEVQPMLKALNALLERLNESIRKERRFTADAAHELRTPLAALRVQAELASQSQDPETRAHALQQLVEGSGRTSRVLDQLLALARIEHDQTLIGDTPIDLQQLARNTLANEAGRALSHHQELALLTDNPIIVNGDATLLQLMLRNLVDNALRYMPEGGVCSISCLSDTDKALLIIEDTGPGIPEESLDRVFDRFYRITGTRQEGTGLGLSLVAEIVRLHHGTIQLSNRLEGTGLTVTVSLPLH